MQKLTRKEELKMKMKDILIKYTQLGFKSVILWQKSNDDLKDLI